MTRLRATALTIAILGLLAAVPPLETTAQQLIFESFPASALIRGENVWLRLDPAADAEVIDLLQRGDPITITDESVLDGEDEYYPVESDLTGESGWIRALFIDPRSISGTSTVVVPLEEVDAPTEEVEVVDDPPDQRQPDREARRRARQANAGQEQKREPEAATEEPANDRAARRAARQAEREANAAGANESADALAFSGSEPTVTPEFTAPSDVLTVTGSFEGNRSFTVIALTPEGTEQVLFDERGPFFGETTFETAEGSTLNLDVDANGAWEVTIEPAT